jgi:hypothetical protein
LFDIRIDLRSTRIIARARKLDLNAVNAVYTVNEQDQNEYEGYLLGYQQMLLPSTASLSHLHSILELRHDWALRNECEELAAPGERKGDDQGAEDEHLCHQEEEDLGKDESQFVSHNVYRVRGSRKNTEELGFESTPLKRPSMMTAIPHASRERTSLQGCSKASFLQRSSLRTRAEVFVEREKSWWCCNGTAVKRARRCCLDMSRRGWCNVTGVQLARW